MKKLLLVLMVVAMASFLLVGCLGEGTVADTDTDTDTDGVTEATMVIDPAYTDPLTLKTYVSGLDNLPDVTVTLPEAAEDGYVVSVGVKWYDEDNEKDVYSNLKEATSTDGIVWTVEEYPFGVVKDVDDDLIEDCTTICVVALLKHPCCPGEEIALEVVTVDKEDPAAKLIISFADCAEDLCASDGAKMLFTSVLAGCEEETCCGDDCSGAGEWTLTIEESDCGAACPVVSGTGCQITDTLPCGCLDYVTPDTSTVKITYNATFLFKDKVGNEVEKEWVIVVDTDSVVSFGEVDLNTDWEEDEFTEDIGIPGSIDAAYCTF